MRLKTPGRILLLAILGIAYSYSLAILLFQYQFSVPKGHIITTNSKAEKDEASFRSQGLEEFNFGKIWTKAGRYPIYTYDKYADGTYYSGLASYSNKSVDLLCETQGRFRKITYCRIRDVYYNPVDRSWHMFLPDIVYAEPIQIFTGIGRGSPFILLHIHPLPQKDLLLSGSFDSIRDTRCLVSVIHQNLFRTLYAAAGVFYSIFKHDIKDVPSILLLGDTDKNTFLSILPRIFGKVLHIQEFANAVKFSDLIVGEYFSFIIRVFRDIQDRRNAL